MRTIWATIGKELLILRRDKAGLLVLFLMPAMLVLIISLIQDNILHTTGTSGVQVLLLNQDGGDVGAKMENWLQEKSGFTLLRSVDGAPLTPDRMRELVNTSAYQMGIVIPPGFTDALRKRADDLARQSLSSTKKGETSKPPEEPAEPAARLMLFFDPIIQGSFRTAVTASLERMLQAIEVEEKSDAFARHFPEAMRGIIRDKILKEVGDMEKEEQDEMIGKIPELQVHWSKKPALALDREVLPAPTAVQQNVPAWTVFGMFFIVVPLGGALLRERQEGTLTRLMTMPVSLPGLLLGKILAYLVVCLIQFGLMLCVGLFVLPAFGTPVLQMGQSPAALLLLAVSSGLAATGFGILIGVVTRSYEQASMFGSVSVVITAAIGGVMVPVYVMPTFMKALSVYSPLAWGLNGFLDIFVRQGTVQSVLPWVARLILFFAVCLGLAWAVLRRRGARR